MITVYDGINSNSPVIGRYCGSMDPIEIRSTSKRMLVTFSSNQYGSSMGFAALYKFVRNMPG